MASLEVFRGLIPKLVYFICDLFYLLVDTREKVVEVHQVVLLHIICFDLVINILCYRLYVYYGLRLLLVQVARRYTTSAHGFLGTAVVTLTRLVSHQV